LGWCCIINSLLKSELLRHDDLLLSWSIKFLLQLYLQQESILLVSLVHLKRVLVVLHHHCIIICIMCIDHGLSFKSYISFHSGSFSNNYYNNKYTDYYKKYTSYYNRKNKCYFYKSWVRKTAWTIRRLLAISWFAARLGAVWIILACCWARLWGTRTVAILVQTVFFPCSLAAACSVST